MTAHTGLAFSPAPGAAPARIRVLQHGWIETRLLARNGEQLLLALVIPIAILIGSRFVGGDLLGDQLPSSVLALAVWSTAFTSTAIGTGFDRRYGVLERLAATPLGPSGLVTGKSLAVVIIVLGQLVILSVVALLLGWRPAFSPGSALVAVLAVVLAIGGFVSIALILAGRLRAEATLALANVIYVVGLIGGGLVIPTDRFGPAAEPVLRLLPTAALGDGLRGAADGVSDWRCVIVLAAWALILTLLARKAFRWIS